MADSHGPFFRMIGIYFIHWSSFELAVDIGITKLSRDTPAHTVRVTQEWMISTKINHLKELVKQSSHPEKVGILDVLDKLPQSSIRNAMAHGYMRFGDDRFIVIHRNKKGKLARHEFTFIQLAAHIKAVTDLAHQLTIYLGNTDTEAEDHLSAYGAP